MNFLIACFGSFVGVYTPIALAVIITAFKKRKRQKGE